MFIRRLRRSSIRSQKLTMIAKPRRINFRDCSRRMRRMRRARRQRRRRMRLLRQGKMRWTRPRSSLRRRMTIRKFRCSTWSLPLGSTNNNWRRPRTEKQRLP